MPEMKQASWRDLYREAVMESDPEKMRARMAVAYRAIRARITEVRCAGANSEEQAQLDCALYFLHVLQGIAEKKSRRLSHDTAAA